MKKKILLFGASGLLGTNFINFLSEKYDFCLVVNENKFFHKNCTYLHLLKEKKGKKSNINTLEEQIKIVSPDIIINCAANTNLDNCEVNKAKSEYVNTLLPKKLSIICEKNNIQFTHISTDHLFKKNVSFKDESFKVEPKNAYAKQKYNAEIFVKKFNKKALIIRTNFFGHSKDKKNFFNEILRKSNEEKKITLFDDYFFTPIYSKYLILAVDKLIAKKQSGVFNVVSNETLSKYEFALIFFKHLKLNMELIQLAKLKDQSFKAKRSTNLSLSNQKLLNTINFKIPSLKSQVKEFINNNDKINKILSKKIPYGKHSINKKDILSVSKVLMSESLTQGNYIQETENKIAKYLGAKYAVVVSSATAGLHISYLALNINKKNKILTTPNTFVSTSNAALYCDSKPIFSDISIDNLNLSLNKLEKNIEKYKNLRIIVPVHFGGLASNMKNISQIAKKNNLNIVEDASHGFGGVYECGAKIGSGKYSDLCVFSFHPVKIIAGGEGGAITTNNKELYKKLLSLRTHGIRKNTEEVINKKNGLTNNKRNLWYYEMDNLGFNYRQTEIHCGLISSQIDRVDDFLKKRKRLAARYDLKLLDNKLINSFQLQSRKRSSNHLYILDIDFKKARLSRNDFMQKLRNHNIISQVHYIPVPIQPYYKKIGYKMKKLKNCKSYYERCLSIPLYYDLTYEEQDYVIDSISSILS